MDYYQYLHHLLFHSNGFGHAQSSSPTIKANALEHYELSSFGKPGFRSRELSIDEGIYLIKLAYKDISRLIRIWLHEALWPGVVGIGNILKLNHRHIFFLKFSLSKNQIKSDDLLQEFQCCINNLPKILASNSPKMSWTWHTQHS